jgi:hypothetical protein
VNQIGGLEAAHSTFAPQVAGGDFTQFAVRQIEKARFGFRLALTETAEQSSDLAAPVAFRIVLRIRSRHAVFALR